MSTVLCAKRAITHSTVDVISHMAPVQLLSHGVIHTTFVGMLGQKGAVAKVKKVRAYGAVTTGLNTPFKEEIMANTCRC